MKYLNLRIHKGTAFVYQIEIKRWIDTVVYLFLIVRLKKPSKTLGKNIGTNHVTGKKKKKGRKEKEDARHNGPCHHQQWH